MRKKILPINFQSILFVLCSESNSLEILVVSISKIKPNKGQQKCVLVLLVQVLLVQIFTFLTKRAKKIILCWTVEERSCDKRKNKKEEKKRRRKK